MELIIHDACYNRKSILIPRILELSSGSFWITLLVFISNKCPSGKSCKRLGSSRAKRNANVRVKSIPNGTNV